MDNLLKSYERAYMRSNTLQYKELDRDYLARHRGSGRLLLLRNGHISASYHLIEPQESGTWNLS